VEDSAPRKLAAILAADVAGYSRLMGQDEEATVRTLSAYRDAIGDVVTTHEGRVFGGAGDSLVAEFSSPVQAVRCALAIQEHIATQNEDLAKDRRMTFRIGVNLGDVIVDGENLLGDGVNVAARLEGLAPPGGICVSAAVFDQVRNRIDAPTADLGRQSFKNIDQPVHAYSIGKIKPHRRGRHRSGHRVGIAAVLAIVVLVGAFFLAGGNGVAPVAGAAPVLVVYPFDAIGEDDRLDQIGDGLRQDLMFSLSRANDRLRVIAVANREAIGDPPPDYVLEGSVRIAGETVRVTALLVEKRSGFQLWGGRFDRDAAAGLTFQDDIATKIAGSLAQKLSDAETERARPPGTMATVIQGLAMIGRFTRDAVALPADLYRRMVGADPDPRNSKASSTLKVEVIS
jgi:adenylate cyclase